MEAEDIRSQVKVGDILYTQCGRPGRDKRWEPFEFLGVDIIQGQEKARLKMLRASTLDFWLGVPWPQVRFHPPSDNA